MKSGPDYRDEDIGFSSDVEADLLFKYVEGTNSVFLDAVYQGLSWL